MSERTVSTRLSVILVSGAFVVALVLLAVNDGERRVLVYRGLVVLTGVAAARILVGWHQSHPPPPDPLRRPRRRVRWRRSTPPPARRGSERVLHLAAFSAGDAHRTLRPLLQTVADERLRAARGTTLDAPDAERHLAPITWELVRPDRPVPHDRRAPGVGPAAIDEILGDLEAL